MAIAIQCEDHDGYNGAKPPVEHCNGCWFIYSLNKSVQFLPGLRVIQPIKLVTEPSLGLATTGEMLAEIKARCVVNGTIGYKTVDRG
jgi:hypothetical protein